MEAAPNPILEQAQRELQMFGELVWGPQFVEGGQVLWGTFTEVGGVSTGELPGITNGKEWYTVSTTHQRVERWLVGEDGYMGGIDTIPFPNDGQALTVSARQIFW